jgi:hypothetical protein
MTIRETHGRAEALGTGRPHKQTCREVFPRQRAVALGADDQRSGEPAKRKQKEPSEGSSCETKQPASHERHHRGTKHQRPKRDSGCGGKKSIDDSRCLDGGWARVHRINRYVRWRTDYSLYCTETKSAPNGIEIQRAASFRPMQNAWPLLAR